MGFLRRLVVPVILALAMVLVLSGSVAAASPQVAVLRDTCTLSGGAHGDGQIVLRVRAMDGDLSGVTKIRFIADLMHQSRGDGGTWTVHLTQTHTSSVTTQTAAGGQGATWSAIWNLGGDTAQFRHRIEETVQFLNSSGGVVAWRGVFGQSC